MSAKRLWLLLLVLVVVTGFELLADFHPFPGISWTHREAMGYGGLVFAGAILLAIFMR